MLHNEKNDKDENDDDNNITDSYAKRSLSVLKQNVKFQRSSF